MDQKAQTYGDKLKYYVDQMASIKKLLKQYQNQNTKLKVGSHELYEQNEILKLNFDKLEAKYEQNLQNEENILHDLQKYMDELQYYKEKCKNSTSEIDRVEAAYNSLRQ